MDPSFTTSTRPGHRTFTQLGVLLCTALLLIVVVANAVWLPFADEVFDPAMFVGVGTFMLVVGILTYRTLRRRERYRLVLDPMKVIVVAGSQTHRWFWEDVTSMAVVTGGLSNLLTIEDERSARADRGMPRLVGTFRVLTKQSPLAVAIPLRGLDAGEATIVEAIRELSNGRFPDRRRDSFQVFSRE